MMQKDLGPSQPQTEPQVGVGPKKGDYRDCEQGKGGTIPKSDQESQMTTAGTLSNT